MVLQRQSIEDLIRQDITAPCPHDWHCDVCEREMCVKIASVADLPSEFGTFEIVGFVNNIDRQEHVAIVKGDIADGEELLLRIHSACLTGDSFGSLRCDCGPQLQTALRRIEAEGRGMVLFLQQEGRGIGILNKLRAYALQDQGFDTFDANVLLGFQPDERNFEVAAEMLKKLGVKSVRLLTNNPEKVEAMNIAGVPVLERVPIELPVSPHNVRYLQTKQERFGHLLHIANENRQEN